MTDRAVVVVSLLLIITLYFEERRADKVHSFVCGAIGANRRDHVLMFVVGKLDRELPFIFCFGRLARAIRFSEDKAAVFARRGAHVTDRADSRTRAGKRLAREKLLSMTTDTSIMVWKVSDIGEITLSGPCGGNFVTGITRQTLVFAG